MHSLQLTLVLLIVIKQAIIVHVQNRVIVELKQRNELIIEGIDHSERDFVGIDSIYRKELEAARVQKNE